MSAYTPSEHIVMAYTEGDCWHLALVIHRRTGWPVLFARSLEWFADDETYWEHVAVQMPDGRVLDIQGVCDLDTWARRWGGGVVTVTDTAEIERDWIDDQERIFGTSTGAVAARLLSSLTPAAPEAA